MQNILLLGCTAKKALKHFGFVNSAFPFAMDQKPEHPSYTPSPPQSPSHAVCLVQPLLAKATFCVINEDNTRHRNLSPSLPLCLPLSFSRSLPFTLAVFVLLSLLLAVTEVTTRHSLIWPFREDNGRQNGLRVRGLLRTWLETFELFAAGAKSKPANGQKEDIERERENARIQRFHKKYNFYLQ